MPVSSLPTVRHIRISASEKMSLLGNLSTMLSAGIPILDAVSAVHDDAKGSVKKVLSMLKDDLEQGKQIWESFSRFPSVFDSVTVNLIRSGEEAGTLAVVLKDLREYIRRDVEFTDKVRFALLYPMLIMTVFSGVLLMILLVVIPKISMVFSRLKIPLPLPTRILIVVSDLLLQRPLLVIGVIAGVLALVALAYAKKRKTFLGVLFSLPLISRLIVEIDLTRVTRNLALLLSSGVPITTALELVSTVVLKPQTSRVIVKSREMILSGKRLSDGLRASRGYLPGMIVTLVEAGEKSGVLDKTMADISEFLDYQVSNTLKTVAAVIEPVLLVLVGVSVGGMMLAIIGPIYGLVGQLGTR